jgi:hypothetical protein
MDAYPGLISSIDGKGYEGFITVSNENFLLAIYSEEREKLVNPTLWCSRNLKRLLIGVENAVEQRIKMAKSYSEFLDEFVEILCLKFSFAEIEFLFQQRQQKPIPTQQALLI